MPVVAEGPPEHRFAACDASVRPGSDRIRRPLSLPGSRRLGFGRSPLRSRGRQHSRPPRWALHHRDSGARPGALRVSRHPAPAEVPPVAPGGRRRYGVAHRPSRPASSRSHPPSSAAPASAPPRRRQQPAHRLLHRLAAEPERRVVHRQEVPRAQRLEHPPCLLRRRVIGDPWVVRTDRQDGEVHPSGAAQPGERVGIGGVAREEHRHAASGTGTRRTRGAGR